MNHNDYDIISSLARATEGCGLALENRGNRAALEANIEYAASNLQHVLELIEQERRDFQGSGQLHQYGQGK